MPTTATARTSRRRRVCYVDRTPILPGDRYLRVVAFPDGIIPGPQAVAKCVPCCIAAGEDWSMDVCSSYCCGDTPCVRRFRHTGEHRCARCPVPDPAAVTR